MTCKQLREVIKECTNSPKPNIRILKDIGIDITRDGKFKVRPEEKTPSCVINRNGSFHDYGSGIHYSDIVSLLYDGYRAFNSLFETMTYVCQELNIDMEAYYE
jgi:hypothetical protein